MGGGSGGHMWHPFDCPDVKTGQDLLRVFDKSAEWLSQNAASLKVDGANLSFRLIKNPDMSTGYEFAVDRGSTSGPAGAYDLAGVTAKTAHLRFVNKKDPSVPHGMVDATKNLLSIFNRALPSILEELRSVGMLKEENIGPEGLYFNTEYVNMETNIKKYPFNFIALHGVRRFVRETPKKRAFKEAPVPQEIINKIAKKAHEWGQKHNPPFKVYGNIPTKLRRKPNWKAALQEKLEINFGPPASDEGEEVKQPIKKTKSLEQWVVDVKRNPIKDVITLTPLAAKNLKIPESQFPNAKKIYMAAKGGAPLLGPNGLVGNIADAEKIADCTAMWEATRVVGNEFLDSSESDDFGPLVRSRGDGKTKERDQEEGIRIDPEGWCANTSFKYSGQFIIDNLMSGFGISENILREQKEGSPIKKVIAVYPGRFHPPGRHHAAAYSWLKSLFGEEETYIATSDKVEAPKSPFTFEEKEIIWSGHGVPSERVVRVKNPYKAEEIMSQHDPETTAVVYMVGSKDMKEDPRFSNVGGTLKSGKAAYLKAYDENKEDLRPLSEHGYLIEAPHMSLAVPGYGEMSGTTLRQFLADSDANGFKAVMGFYDDQIHEMIKKVLKEGESRSNFLTMESLFSLVDNLLLERELSSKELKSREDYAKSLPDEDFKKRYGKDWMQVKMATATKMAKKKNEQHLNELDEKAAELQIAKIIARLMMQDPELKQIPADKITATAKEIGQMSAEELGDLSAQTPSGDDKAAIVSQDLQREASVAGGGGVPGYGAPAFKTRRKKHEQR